MNKRHKLRAATAVVAFTAILAGCGANRNSVWRNEELSNLVNVASLDAKQRVILSKKRRGEHGILERVVCAEPSPDALSVLASTFGANVDVPAKVAVALSGSQAESAGSIGLRTQSIQLLRDAAYRNCEAYASGAIDEFDYATLLRRNQVYTTAVLAIEQLTGAVRAPQVTFSTGTELATGEALAKNEALIATAQEELSKLEKDLEAAEAALKAAKEEEKETETKDVANAQEAITEKKKTIASYKARRSQLLNSSAALTSSANIESVTTGYNKTIKDVAGEVYKIVDRTFDDMFFIDFCQMYWTGSEAIREMLIGRD